LFSYFHQNKYNESEYILAFKVPLAAAMSILPGSGYFKVFWFPGSDKDCMHCSPHWCFRFDRADFLIWF